MPSKHQDKIYRHYLAAVNEHNIEKALSFYEDNLESQFCGTTVIKGKDQLREYYEKRIADPNYSLHLIEYLPVDSDDRIRAHLKTSNGEELDITYVFSKENPEHFTGAYCISVDEIRVNRF